MSTSDQTCFVLVEDPVFNDALQTYTFKRPLACGPMLSAKNREVS
jgi:hypothetical protein